MEYYSTVEAQDALFSRGTIEVDHVDELIQTPVKAVPVKTIEDEEEDISRSRNVAEVYQEIDYTDLREFREYNEGERSEKPDFIKHLSEKLEYARESELKFTFFDYTETNELRSHDIRTYIELSKQYSDVVIAPIQSGLLRELSDSSSVNDGVYRAHRNLARTFSEEVQDIEKPSMGVVPLFERYEQVREHIDIYEDNNVHNLCIDYKGCTPTKEGYLGTYNNLVRNMAKKGIMEDRLMYALNPRTYSSHPSDGHSTAESFLLACMGFDIIGEKHIGYGSGGDDKTPLEINIFRRDEIVLQRREASNLYVDFPESELDSFYFEGSDARARRLRRLFNAEQMEFAFEDLQEAIDGGRASGHLQSKPGLTRDKLGAVRGVGEYYDGTIGRELSEYAD